MKKILLGLIIGIAISVPATVVADHGHHILHANTIYTIGDGGVQVDVFDDGNNKCYVAYEKRRPSDSMPSISCVAEE